MAYLSNRAYAFQPFIWEMWTTDQLVKSDDGVTLRSARIPLNAFISGPTAGGHMSMPAPGWDVTAPRAVSYDFFEEVRFVFSFSQSSRQAAVRLMHLFNVLSA